MRAAARGALSVLCALASACSLRFDEDADEVEVRGEARPLREARLVHRGEYTRDIAVVPGAGAVPHLLVRREGVAVSLAPGGAREVIEGQLNEQDGRVYSLQRRLVGAGLDLTVRRVGERGPALRVPVAGAGRLFFSADVFALWSDAAGCVELGRFLGDGSLRRAQVCGLAGEPLSFDPEGQALFSRDSQGRVYAYHSAPPDRVSVGTCQSFVPPFDSTGGLFQCVGTDGRLLLYRVRGRRILDLGVVREPYIAGDVPERRSLLLCGPSGLRALSYADFSELRLTARRCLRLLSRSADRALFWSTDDVLYQVPLDGGGTEPVLNGREDDLLGACGDHVAHTPAQPGGGGGDAALGRELRLDGERLAERGLDLRLDDRCRRVRWRGEPSYGGRLGALLSASLPPGRPLRLGIQSTFHQELPDGRLIAATNMDGDALLMLIDEGRRLAQPLVSGAQELVPSVVPVPELQAVLVQTWTPPKDYAVYLVGLPP